MRDHDGNSGATATPACLTLLEDLIGFPTVSRDSNLDLIHYCRDRLAAHGIAGDVIVSGDQRKANLLARIGDGDGPGLILSGHTDVVPVDGQDWQTDPFQATRVGDRIHGRGTADMKGFVASVLAALPRMLAAPLVEPFYLALSYDEEVGCAGVPSLLARVKDLPARPRGCIIGEPTDMRVIVGHKSGSVYRCTVRGHEVHSSLAPLGVNAIEYAARLIIHISRVAEDLARDERRHLGFDIPHSTMQTGTIAGGIAPNIVPAECSFRFDMRCLPWTSPSELLDAIRAYADDHLLPEMRARATDAMIMIDRLGEVPHLNTDEAAELVTYASALARDDRKPGYVGFGTEGGLFSQLGIPTIVCGPGSIEQAHRPNEWIALDQLAAGEAFLDRLIDAQSRPTATQ